MIFKIVAAKPIKEMVIRFSVVLFEMQGPREVMHSEYDIAVDVSQNVQVQEDDEGKLRLNIDGDAIMRELTDTIVRMQYTSGVAQQMISAKWNAISEEEKTEQELEDGYPQALSDALAQ